MMIVVIKNFIFNHYVYLFSVHERFVKCVNLLEFWSNKYLYFYDVIQFQSSEMWSEVAQNHKGTSGPWILHNTIGSNTSTTLMEREDAIFKCKDAEEAILALLGLYYLGSLPYPPQITGPLLLLQHLVLEDKVHSGDLPTLQKARKEFTAYKERSESHSLDSFF